MSPTATAKTTAPRARTARRELPGGYTGRLLRANLTTGKTWAEDWGPDEMRDRL